jgi:hypothetical protein
MNIAEVHDWAIGCQLSAFSLIGLIEVRGVLLLAFSYRLSAIGQTIGSQFWLTAESR